MAIYVYEIIPQRAGEKRLRFEVEQSMNDAPLTHHPENGKPVRRVILGGFGVMKAGARPPRPHGCGCGRRREECEHADACGCN
jgi:hypothetical protein